MQQAENEGSSNMTTVMEDWTQKLLKAVEGLEFRSQYLARLKRILEKVGVSGVLSKWSNLD